MQENKKESNAMYIAITAESIVLGMLLSHYLL